MPTIFDYIMDESSIIEEATLSQLATKQKSVTRLFPDFFTKSNKVPGVIAKGGVRMTGMEKDTWNFKIHSGTEEGLWYEATLRWKNIPDLLKKLVADRRLWNKEKTKVDLKKLAAKAFKQADVELLCNCPADKMWGSHYIRSQDKYKAKYGEPENRPPDIRNPKKYGAYCKHLQVLMKVLPWYKSTMANWLKKNYEEVIKREEDKAAKRAGKYAGLGKALGKRKAKESIDEHKIPKILFHATNSENVDSIKKYGLIAVPDEAFFEGGTPGVNFVSRKSYLPFRIHNGSYIKVDTHGLNSLKFLSLGSGWYRYIGNIAPKHIVGVELMDESIQETTKDLNKKPYTYNHSKDISVYVVNGEYVRNNTDATVNTCKS